METDYTISIYLDSRRGKSNGKFPVKIRVYSNMLKKAKFYPIDMDMSAKEFQSIWETTKPRMEYREQRHILQSAENKANVTAKTIVPFSFENFEKKLYRKTGDGENIFYQYQLIIDRLRKSNQFGTASNYDLSLKSLKSFIIYDKGKEAKKLLFAEISVSWLNNYETYMIETKKRSRTTVSMYLRALRTVFNTAISQKEIDKEIYPFGKRKYEIPATRNVKKALSKEDLRILFEAKPKTIEQEKAKDFWFFSYVCNGMNVKDIALLRYENLKDNTLTFFRAKTINTSKSALKPVTIPLHDYANIVIEKYGNSKKKSGELIFPIISDLDSNEVNFKKIKNFTQAINQNLKKLAKTNGISEDISTYWARHSFATSAIRNGESMEFVSEALNHSNMNTTQGYFAGFDESRKRELTNTLLNF